MKVLLPTVGAVAVCCFLIATTDATSNSTCGCPVLNPQICECDFSGTYGSILCADSLLRFPKFTEITPCKPIDRIEMSVLKAVGFHMPDDAFENLNLTKAPSLQISIGVFGTITIDHRAFSHIGRKIDSLVISGVPLNKWEFEGVTIGTLRLYPINDAALPLIINVTTVYGLKDLLVNGDLNPNDIHVAADNNIMSLNLTTRVIGKLLLQKLTNLRRLNLGSVNPGAKVLDVSNIYYASRKLESLVLDEIELPTFPSQLWPTYPNLKHLELNKNGFTSLDGAFDLLTHDLEYVRVQDAQIASLGPRSFRANVSGLTIGTMNIESRVKEISLDTFSDHNTVTFNTFQFELGENTTMSLDAFATPGFNKTKNVTYWLFADRGDHIPNHPFAAVSGGTRINADLFISCPIDCIFGPIDPCFDFPSVDCSFFNSVTFNRRICNSTRNSCSG